ncbi:MAG: cytochrome P450 [Alphaproteobacteria bacterium]
MTATYAPDLFSPHGITEPFGHYAAMRELGPVVWLEATGCWATTTYAAAEEALARDDVFRSGRGVSLNDDMNKNLVGSTLNSDAPEHGQRKKVSIRPLMPASLKPLEPSIEAASRTLVESLPSEVEAVSQISQYLPLNIVVDLLGLPADRATEMLDWASATFNFMGPPNELALSKRAALADLRDFITDPNTRKRLTPGGWAAALFEAEERGKIPKGWASEQMRDYLNPSLDTTIAATSYGLWLFAQQPEVWDRLRADHSLIPAAIEDIVRLATPIRGFSRYIGEDTELAGQPVKEGQRVFILFAAANRDPDIFDRPHELVIDRPVNRHMGFGQGRHFCLGMHLARMEIRCLLTELAKRVRRFEVTGEARIGLNNTIYGLEHLPLRLHFED